MDAVKQKASAATVQRAAAQPLFVQRTAAAAARVHPPSVRLPSPRIQPSLRVSTPGDAAEKEADATARAVVRMNLPDRAVAFVRTAAGGVFRAVTGREKEKEEPGGAKAGVRGGQPPRVARFAGTGLLRRPDDEVRRKAEGMPDLKANVEAEIRSASGGGSPLPLSVRRFMEPRFKADFSQVRVHTGDRAAKLNRQLNAKAFAVGNNVFFGRGQFRPETGEGRELIAHELTHTIQQGAAVQRSEEVTVTQQSPEQVQRLGVSDVLDYFADKANLIPGYRMLTIVLGVNPVNMSRVERSAANILRAVVEFIPGGNLITRALDNYGVFERAGAWVEEQIRTLGMTGSLFSAAIDEFLDSLSWTDIFDLGGVWRRAKRIFSEPVDRLIAFAGNLIDGILRFIRDAILRPLAGLAQGTRGYDLLKAILGQDPITGDPYPRTADTLIGGFMKLIGQEEIWENIKKANAIARAFAWFEGALSSLMAMVRAIPGRFVEAVRSLTITDIVLLPRAFARVAGVFLDVVGGFFSWAGNQVLGLLEIIFEVVAPAAVPYLRKAAGAFRSILTNPIGFIGNLVRAGIQGFRQFGTNFLTHLRASVIGWLTGAMSGANIYIPQGLTLPEIVKFVLSVLGLTWQNLRVKLVRVVGETAVGALETGFDLVKTLVTQGPAAAWEKIQESLSNLREMVMEQIMTFVRERVVNRAIQTLLSSLNPAGAFIQAVIAIYNTIMFFVERLRQIAQVAMAFIDSISAIAGGVIATAANKVEQTMAGLLTLVISFLARLAGLGNVSDAVVGVVNRVRAPIDRALDRVVEWIVAQARRLGRLVASGARGVATRVANAFRRPVRVGRESHTLVAERTASAPRLMIESTPQHFGTWLSSWRPEVMQRARTYNKRDEVAAAFEQIQSLVSRTPRTVDIPPETVDAIAAKIGEISQMVRLGEEIQSVLQGLSTNDIPTLDRSLRNLTSATVLGAALALRAREVERAHWPTGIAGMDRLRVSGVGLGVALLADGTVRKVYALNDVLLSGKHARFVPAFTAMYQAIRATLEASGFTYVGGGTVRIVPAAEQAEIQAAHSTIDAADVIRSIQGHEEDLIRTALAADAQRMTRGVRVVVGVPQSTVCNRCVIRLGRGETQPLPVGFQSGARERTEQALIAAVAPAQEAQMLVLGTALASALAGV